MGKPRSFLKIMDFVSSRSHRTCIYKCGDACSKPAPNQSDNAYFGDLVKKNLSRRALLKGGGATVITLGGASFLAACTDNSALSHGPSPSSLDNKNSI